MKAVIEYVNVLQNWNMARFYSLLLSQLWQDEITTLVSAT